jgi:DNA-binding transcriptional ArsR family regulator
MGGADPAAMAAAAERAARLLRLMGHEGRLMVLCHLAQGEETVGALEAKLGMGQSALSQHLAKLRADGLVAATRDGLHMRYRLASPEAARVLETLYGLFCPIP